MDQLIIKRIKQEPLEDQHADVAAVIHQTSNTIKKEPNIDGNVDLPATSKPIKCEPGLDPACGSIRAGTSRPHGMPENVCQQASGVPDVAAIKLEPPLARPTMVPDTALTPAIKLEPPLTRPTMVPDTALTPAIKLEPPLTRSTTVSLDVEFPIIKVEKDNGQAKIEEVDSKSDIGLSGFDQLHENVSDSQYLNFLTKPKKEQRTANKQVVVMEGFEVKCPVCEKLCKGLENHLLSSHFRSPFRCHPCIAKYNLVLDFSYYDRMNATVMCSSCEGRYLNKIDLRTHILKKHPDVPRFCSICKEIIKSIDWEGNPSMKSVKLECVGEMFVKYKNQCGFCHKQFRETISLAYHHVRWHPTEALPECFEMKGDKLILKKRPI